MSPAGFEPTIPASKRQQTYNLGRAITGIDCFNLIIKELLLLEEAWPNLLTGELHNSVTTRLKATLLYTYIEKGRGGG
jgi:hypothetical protein